MAEALGVRFLDSAGQSIGSGIAGLEELAEVDLSGIDPRLAAGTFEALSDVQNPLAGPDGAVFVYGPQKGLPAARLSELDRALGRYGELVGKAVGSEISCLPGGGSRRSRRWPCRLLRSEDQVGNRCRARCALLR